MTWKPVDGFGIEHLPYGSFSTGGTPRLGIRVGDRVLDAAWAARSGHLPESCDAPNLDRLLSTDHREWDEVRATLISLLTDDAWVAGSSEHFYELDGVTMHLPFTVGDYVDFYSSEAHATNVGRLFRPDQEPLLPNWKYLPVGYHGRAGTVVVSGAPIPRPAGQRRGADGSITVGPSVRLDIELEMAVVVGGASQRGDTIPIDRAGEHIFGLALLNDWSARDIQAWEYAPLGPFLGKSFATSIAAWITQIAALEQYRVPGPEQLDPVPFDYLRTDDPWAFDIALEVRLQTESMRAGGHQPFVVSVANYREMYWTMAQQLAHMTVNGATIRAGDLYGSGTISGWNEGEEGSLLERTLGGHRPIDLPDGSSRTFLEDGDEVTLAGRAGTISMGEVKGRIVG